ncbi:unnamed protein product [Kuraishia capsulata CBS 1993]|uniref:Anaphase-promoting complex subunit 11 n=1 Tax=Kuraishia capsulata CBS 1993 TaxID=1382522 RepID=W6MMZ9_9ASCO|nr:uncharacterized protein KUCA_T00002359001 [Kuraishia capsulata CBS 1993]CDK26387.1 unnamed protein product [Kuraishia capsulata CBS 1993]
MKIKINNWHAVYAWHWDVSEDEVCGICRVSFDGTCPACKFPGDDCPLVVGECQHSFHMHCILKWLETPTAKGLCPMCRQAFTVKGDHVNFQIPAVPRDVNSDAGSKHRNRIANCGSLLVNLRFANRITADSIIGSAEEIPKWTTWDTPDGWPLGHHHLALHRTCMAAQQVCAAPVALKTLKE